MKVYQIVESKLDEYVGGGAGARITPERMAELNFEIQGSWHVYGSDTSTWEYSSTALRDLFVEGLEQHITHTFDLDPESDQGKELTRRIVNWFENEPGGQTAKQNIIKAFRYASERDGQNDTDPLKHNEALGLMMNMLLLVNNAINALINRD